MAKAVPRSTLLHVCEGGRPHEVRLSHLTSHSSKSTLPTSMSGFKPIMPAGRRTRPNIARGNSCCLSAFKMNSVQLSSNDISNPDQGMPLQKAFWVSPRIRRPPRVEAPQQITLLAPHCSRILLRQSRSAAMTRLRPAGSPLAPLFPALLQYAF
jgi:hypothetical protein